MPKQVAKKCTFGVKLKQKTLKMVRLYPTDTIFYLIYSTVTDRLAYFNFVQGSLASTLSTKLDASRTPLKALRDSEATLSTRRNIRAGYDREISKAEMDKSRNGEKRIQELTALLRKAEIDDEPLEKENERLARNAIRESEKAKWDAIREVRIVPLLRANADNPISTAKSSSFSLKLLLR